MDDSTPLGGAGGRRDLEAELAEYRRGLALASDDLWAHRKVCITLRRLKRRNDFLTASRELAQRYANSGDFLQLLGILRLILAEDPSQPVPAALADALASPPPAAVAAPPPLIALMNAERAHWLGAPHFSNLGPRSLTAMLERLRLVRLSSDTVLLQEGQPATAVYLLLEGAVGIARHDQDGNDYLVETLEEGALLGEMELFTGTSCLSTVQVIEDSLVLELPAACILELAARNGQLAAALLGLFYDRLATNLQRAMPCLRHLTGEQRQLLLQRCRLVGYATGELAYLPERDVGSLNLVLRGRIGPMATTQGRPLEEGAVFGDLDGLLPANVHVGQKALAPSLLLTLQRSAVAQFFRPNAALMADLQAQAAAVAQPAPAIAVAQKQSGAAAAQTGLSLLQGLERQEATGELIVLFESSEAHLFWQAGRLAWGRLAAQALPFTRSLEIAGIAPASLRRALGEGGAPVDFAANLRAAGVTQAQLMAALQAQVAAAAALVAALPAPLSQLFVPRQPQVAPYDSALTFTLSQALLPSVPA